MANQLFILAFIDSNGDQNIIQQIFDERESLPIPDEGIKAIMLANFYDVDFPSITTNMVNNAVLQKALNEPPQYYTVVGSNDGDASYALIGPFTSIYTQNNSINELKKSHCNDTVCGINVIDGTVSIQ